MMLSKVACVVNYCTQDWRYLDLCLEPLLQLFEVVIVPVCDHFFNGEKEDRALLDWSYRRHPKVQFIEFAYDEKLYGLNPLLYEESQSIHYWHSTARYIGAHFVPKSIEWLLFLDVDEIIDLPRFKHWSTHFPIGNYDALRFDSFFYFRESFHRALTYTQNALLVRKSLCHPDLLLVVAERMGTYDRIDGKRVEHVRGDDDFPLFHHYSWVRTPEELFHKVKCWGHHADQDWTTLLCDELSHAPQKRDCLYGLEYEKVNPLHNPLVAQKPITSPTLSKSDNNVIKVDRKRMLEMHFHAYY